MQHVPTTNAPSDRPATRTRSLMLCSALLFLSGCVPSPVKDDLPARPELDVLVLGVETMAKPREPAGEVKLAEDVQDVGQGWNLLLDLEEVDWLHEQDKENIVEFVTKAVDRIKASLRECTRWDRLVNRRECR